MANYVLIGASGEGMQIRGTGDRVAAIVPPAVLRNLQAIGSLLSAKDAVAEVAANQLVKMATEINHSVRIGLEQSFEIDDNTVITFVNPEGGFVCGSTGQPPLPLPVSPSWLDSQKGRALRGIGGDLLKAYGLDEDAALFLREAIERKADVRNLFLEPERAAADAGVQLSPEVSRQLEFIRKGEGRMSGPEAEVLEFVNRVVKDGRHIREWAVEPRETAKQLGVRVSDEAFQMIENGINVDMRNILGGRTPHNPEVASSVIGIVITIGIAMYSSYEVERPHVVDQSGLRKF